MPVCDFERVLFFASGFGVAAALPYLRKLVHGRAQGESKPRTVCLIWHVNNIGRQFRAGPAGADRRRAATRCRARC